MTSGGIERVLRSASAALTGRVPEEGGRPGQRVRHHRGYEVRCEVSPLSGPCVCLHHWSAKTRRETNRQTHRCSEQAGAIGVVMRHRRGYGRRLMAPYGHPIHH